LDRPKDFFGAREPLISLMTGVASTGAAVSPAMGRRTIDVARPIIALVNLRLGCWLPNPLSRCISRDVAAPDSNKRLKRRKALGSGYDEFLPELFGLHRHDASRVYVSDGGHYDNLGLLALLQARCKEIWCVDAEADPKGEAGQIRQVVKLAKEDLDIGIEIDLNQFTAGVDGILGAGHAVGQITYPDQSKGKLIVVKLGLTEDSPQALKDYRAQDMPFPYHSTFWKPWGVMWYDEERFDSYRQVGLLNAQAAAADPEAPQ
jgi:hypothetical protein